MAPIVATTEVDRPAEEVFAYATDPTRFNEWQDGVVEGHLEQAGPLRVGDRFVTTRRIGGANRPASQEVTRIEPPRAWEVRGVDGPVRAAVDVTVDALSETRSRLTISIDFQGHGVGKALVPLVVRRQAEKEMPANLETLKQRLEAAN
jgi:uncharacterized protein YndB with AHSA1/START domain